MQVEPAWLEVTRVDVPVPGLSDALEGFTIAQLGDFHLGRYVSAQRVRRSVETANDLGPELIVLTGDFVYGSASYSEPCARELASLKAQCGVFAVLGNHDVWTGADQVAASVEGAGIGVVRNAAQAVYVGDTRIWLVGVEDTGYTAGFYGGSFSDFRAAWQGTGERFSTLLEEIPANEPRLLLVHNPDFTEMLPKGRIDLALCGHTHGGQVHLPLLGRPVVPSCFGEKYASGLVRGPTTLVYVNRGIGLIAPPVRFNCRPEVTLLRLRSA
jgi:predicted MPP superfamily phosphohydrolase